MTAIRSVRNEAPVPGDAVNDAGSASIDAVSDLDGDDMVS
jgi:hypothetical protein